MTTATAAASVESRMAPQEPTYARVTQIAKTPTMITYQVTFKGIVLGEIERTVWSERRRFPGKMYGYDMARKPHFRISKIGNEPSHHQSYSDSRADAVAWLWNMTADMRS